MRSVCQASALPSVLRLPMLACLPRRVYHQARERPVGVLSLEGFFFFFLKKKKIKKKISAGGVWWVLEADNRKNVFPVREDENNVPVREDKNS